MTENLGAGLAAPQRYGKLKTTKVDCFGNPQEICAVKILSPMIVRFPWMLLASVVLLASVLGPSMGGNGVVCAELPLQRAFLDGSGPGWVALTGKDFVNINCAEDTWAWKGGNAHCTGNPVGVIRSQKEYENFELVAQWKHLRSAGNSGIFVWTVPESLTSLAPGNLPSGIEVQILDHGYAENYEKRHGKKSDWFTTNGDVFAVRTQMTPFPPLSANGSRSFPSEDRAKGFGHWNHYYIRAINGEVRLWVNGGEVSGGNHCEPRRGYLCLESEGSPIEFRHIRIRELP